MNVSNKILSTFDFAELDNVALYTYNAHAEGEGRGGKGGRGGGRLSKWGIREK